MTQFLKWLTSILISDSTLFPFTMYRMFTTQFKNDRLKNQETCVDKEQIANKFD